ncbi:MULTISPECIES: extracellular solute-binding protein [Micromonospora]|uniref:Putative aldouronate transport system substrate-binding protein n=1 Tax=Micromonospora yangpuensis TaxID=683228 RepID=A0A1C6UQ68_9ACTN|nr:extracellular solute-binding protein [Micromonospora yangpuensis]GGM07847.1 sugar ABC transporter substrate-binding protein [Micromonospora yangpuensis]SCL56195.1 putative aldouronate transport system substrate-binding protein [Micromonospora yangpuensis]
MTPSPPGASTDRRTVLRLIGLGAAATIGGTTLAGCSKEVGSQGSATKADAIKAVLPAYQPAELLKPDIPGEGSIPSGYLKYPTDLVDAVTEQPIRSGQPIRAISPWWGPTPPANDRNAYMQAINAKLGGEMVVSVQDGNTFADKLSALLGARDVPDLLSVPNWEVDKIARFSDATKALFEDLTDHLQGDKAAAYPYLAALPTSSWEYCVWGGRLYAAPFPPDGPFAWLLFQRKDLVDAAGLGTPTSIDELYEFGKKATNADRGVWAFGTVFDMVQQFHGCHQTWRKKPDGGLEHKYETAEFTAALEFTARLFAEGLVHPDTVASKGADEKQLFNGGKILMFQDGAGAWEGMQGEQSKVTPGYTMQPVPLFGVGGKDPVVWGKDIPVFYTFVKKGLGTERVQELLRVMNWCAAPFGSREFELREYGVQGTHFTRGADGTPASTEQFRKEFAGQVNGLAGRPPVKIRRSDAPTYVQEYIEYHKKFIGLRETDLFAGIKLELPANWSKQLQPTDDKIRDILRGRRPLTDMAQVTKEFLSGGGEEGRAFHEKALSDNGR